MKRYFRYSLLAMAVLGMVGCGEDEPVDQDVSISVKEPVVDESNAETEQRNIIISDADQPIPPEHQQPVQSDSGAIDYSSAIDTQKGLQALEASREAVQMGLDAINKDEVKVIAGALAGKAAKFAKDNGLPDGSGTTGGWKKIYADSAYVLDGDTIDVYREGKPKERIRMIGIDAPESSQEYGKNSGQTLENCLANGPIVVSYVKDNDGKNRILGKVEAGGVDCNYEQVKVGSAWHYKQYQDEQPSSDIPLYSKSELQARSGQKGLWANPNAIEPWMYRRTHK